MTGEARSQATAASGPLDIASTSAVIFDYGNTIVPFGHEAVADMNGALERVLAHHYGDVDRDALDRVRAADRMQPYESGFKENDLPELCRNLVRVLYGREATPQALDDLLTARYESFLASVALPEGVKPLLQRLALRRGLGVLSNYPDGNAVRDSMSRIGILELFDAVVVSGDVGYCKPDSRPFAAVAERMGAWPDETLFVGDNWLADIQGAKRYGMRAALTTQYVPLEDFAPEPGDAEPDLVVGSLDELELALQA